MSKTSWNLSDRIFFTINYNNGTAIIGYLDGDQEILVGFTPDELATLRKSLQNKSLKLTEEENVLSRMLLNWALEYVGTYQEHLWDKANVLVAKLKEGLNLANSVKQIVIPFSPDIKDDLIEEIKGEIEFWIENEYDQLKHENNIFIPQYKCRWCWEDITKEEYTDREELCDGCWEEYLGER